jgi:glycosyltransferase involved in cell wall biosynthesis
LFLLPSYYEGLPIALLEALSYGLSCIVSDIPAHQEVELSNDRYFKPGDAAEMACAIIEFVNRGFEEPEKKAQQELISRKYDWDSIAERTMSIYQSL